MASEKLKDVLKGFRKMAKDELAERQRELRSELFKLRTTGTTEKVKDVSQFRKIRKDIARIQTILRQADLKQAQA